MTEWKQFVHPISRTCQNHAPASDLRRLKFYNPETIRWAGFTYYSIGRPTQSKDELHDEG
jgi:hypothetical protein